jgi:NTE family protein
MARGTTSTTARREPLLVDLALQGGGAHGAFTWGVIDRLLQEPWLEFDGISRDLGGRNERGGDGRRLRRGWARRGARRARGLLAPGGAGCHLQPVPADAA